MHKKGRPMAALLGSGWKRALFGCWCLQTAARLLFLGMAQARAGAAGAAAATAAALFAFARLAHENGEEGSQNGEADEDGWQIHNNGSFQDVGAGDPRRLRTAPLL